MIELEDIDIMTTSIKMLHMFNKVEENMIMIRRAMEDTKSMQSENLEMKNKISKMINTLDVIYHKLDTAENCQFTWRHGNINHIK